MNTSGHKNGEWLRMTRLYHEWQEIREEIMRHKWYESEKAGHDIGWERAMVDWLIRYGRHRRHLQS